MCIVFAMLTWLSSVLYGSLDYLLNYFRNTQTKVECKGIGTKEGEASGVVCLA
jgi:hypothetical protein